MSRTVTLALLCCVLLPLANADEEGSNPSEIDLEAGPLPSGWVLGPAAFFKSGIYVDRDPKLIPVPTVY
jgi:hypothetical protein